MRKLAVGSSDGPLSFVKHYLGSQQRDGFAKLQENSEEVVASLKNLSSVGHPRYGLFSSLCAFLSLLGRML